MYDIIERKVVWLTKINKVIAQMKREKLIFLVDTLWDSDGHKYLGMEQNEANW